MNECTYKIHTQHTCMERERDTHIFCFIWQSFSLVHFLARCYIFIVVCDGVFLCICIHIHMAGCVCFCFCLFMLVNMLYNTMDANENNRHKKWHKRRKLQPNINYILFRAFSVLDLRFTLSIYLPRCLSTFVSQRSQTAMTVASFYHSVLMG